jgi:hypothetical protein
MSRFMRGRSLRHPLGKFSGQVTPAPVSSVSNQMTIVFTTDTSHKVGRGILF